MIYSRGICDRILFFFNDTATTEIYTLSLHDPLPISHSVLFTQSGRSVWTRASPARHYSSTLSGAALRMVDATDRKSTRLNSSHSQISYAVFCLKKKTCDTSAQRRAGLGVTRGATPRW